MPPVEFKIIKWVRLPHPDKTDDDSCIMLTIVKLVWNFCPRQPVANNLSFKMQSPLPLLALFALLVLVYVTAGLVPPKQAAAVGYTINTFSTVNFTNQIDISNSYNSGFQWYPWSHFGHSTNYSAIVVNTDGTLTLQGDATGPNGELNSATYSKNTTKCPSFVGTAFGGGAYFEAIYSFDANNVLDLQLNGWPSFWALPVESTFTQTSAWLGKEPGFTHYVELDFFEYNAIANNASGLNYYGQAVLDWYGTYAVTCPGGFCKAGMSYSAFKRTVPANTNFSQFHKFGFLWVPATEITKGYAQSYFDDVPTGIAYSWSQFSNQAPIPLGKPWQFGRMDKFHYFLILGTGFNMPMKIQSVNVWQASTNNNMNC